MAEKQNITSLKNLGNLVTVNLEEMEFGRITNFKPTNNGGYGFITSGHENGIFFHSKNVKNPPKACKNQPHGYLAGQPVRYLSVATHKGVKAQPVVLVDEPEYQQEEQASRRVKPNGSGTVKTSTPTSTLSARKSAGPQTTA